MISIDPPDSIEAFGVLVTHWFATGVMSYLAYLLLLESSILYPSSAVASVLAFLLLLKTVGESIESVLMFGQSLA